MMLTIIHNKLCSKCIYRDNVLFTVILLTAKGGWQLIIMLLMVQIIILAICEQRLAPWMSLTSS